jgi:hypothetical protein
VNIGPQRGMGIEDRVSSRDTNAGGGGGGGPSILGGKF